MAPRRISRSKHPVADFIENLLFDHPDFMYLDNFPEIKVIVSMDSLSDKENVAIVASGEKKAHLFAAERNLSAASYGDNFSIPSPDSVLAFIRVVISRKGCSLIVHHKHLRSFKIASERSREEEGLLIEIMIVKNSQKYLLLMGLQQPAERY